MLVIFEFFGRMATVARGFFMPAVQRKIRLLVVVKGDFIPAFRGGAGVAFLAIAALVDIVDLVAADAFFRRVLVLLINVARRAVRFRVCAFQREFRFLVMIEC